MIKKLTRTVKKIIGIPDYKVSVIVPIYNTGRFLEEALDSLYGQTIGLKNIQIILIDDGSTDDSAAICKRAKNLHRKNIVFKRQQNKGASAARNHGLKYVKGKYVTFLDSDDTLDQNFIKRLYQCMEKNGDSINMAVGRLCYFEKKEGFLHKLDYKFSKNGIVDLNERPEFVQQHAASSLFKSNIARKYRFDENLKMGEDVLYVSEILSTGLSYGIEKNAVYNYRIREDNTAASSDYLCSRLSFDGIIDCYNKIIDISKTQFGSLLHYYQHVIMFDLQFRIANELPDVFVDEEERNEYIDGIVRLIQQIDDTIILKQRTLLQGYKIYALSLKYGYDITEKSTINNAILSFNGNSYLDLRNHLKILSVSSIEGGMHIDGRQSYSIIRESSIFVNIVGTDELIPVVDNDEYDIVFKAFDGNIAFTIKGFSVFVPCDSLEKVDFILKTKDNKSIILKKTVS